MHIKIKLKYPVSSGEGTVKVHFPIDVKDLKEATLTSYLDLGTHYSPISADSFINLGKNQFPLIGPNTKVSISLEDEKDGDNGGNGTTDLNANLICCKLINVGKGFNSGLRGTHETLWNSLFYLDDGDITLAPDGTLYVGPHADNGKCVIRTKAQVPNAYLAYSIVFSFFFEERNYYFVLDPIVRVNSGRD